MPYSSYPPDIEAIMREMYPEYQNLGAIQKKIVEKFAKAWKQEAERRKTQHARVSADYNDWLQKFNPTPDRQGHQSHHRKGESQYTPVSSSCLSVQEAVEFGKW